MPQIEPFYKVAEYTTELQVVEHFVGFTVGDTISVAQLDRKCSTKLTGRRAFQSNLHLIRTPRQPE